MSLTKTTTKSDLASLTMLGQSATKPSKKLERFPNHHPGRRYVVTLSTDEFTCICPMTGQPDFATITINYIPDRWVVESKSLKLYLWSYRNEGIFQEHLTNVVLDDLVKALKPHWCEVIGAFKVRGGIAITVRAEYDRSKKVTVQSAARPLPRRHEDTKDTKKAS